MDSMEHFYLSLLAPDVLSCILSFLESSEIMCLVLSGDKSLQLKLSKPYIWQSLVVDLSAHQMASFMRQWALHPVYLPSTLRKLDMTCFRYSMGYEILDWKVNILPQTLIELKLKTMYVMSHFMFCNLNATDFEFSGLKKHEVIVSQIEEFIEERKPLFLRLNEHLPKLELLEATDLNMETIPSLQGAHLISLQRDFSAGLPCSLNAVLCSWLYLVEALVPQLTTFEMVVPTWDVVRTHRWPCKLEKLTIFITNPGAKLTHPEAIENMKYNLENLRDLQTDYLTLNEVHMPRLTRLRLCNTIPAVFAGKPLLQALSTTCPLLNDLFITFIRAPDQFEDIPAQITKLDVSAVSNYAPLVATHVQKLPRNITDLTLIFAHDLKGGIPQAMPPKLKILHLDFVICRDHELMELPETLTKVSVREVILTGRIMDPIHTILLSPRTILHDSLEQLQSRFSLTWKDMESYPTIDLSFLPPSTTRIADLNFDMFSPDELPKALMRLHASYLARKEMIEQLPRCLTRLNLGSSMEVPWKILKALPLCFRLLKGGTVAFIDDDDIDEVLVQVSTETSTLEVPDSFSDFAAEFFNQRYSPCDENSEFIIEPERYAHLITNDRKKRGHWNGSFGGKNCILKPDFWLVDFKARHMKRFEALLHEAESTYPISIKLQYFYPIPTEATDASDDSHDKFGLATNTETLGIDWPKSLTALSIPVHLVHLAPSTNLKHLKLHMNHRERASRGHLPAEPCWEETNLPSTLESLCIYGTIFTQIMLDKISQLRNLESLNLSKCHGELKRANIKNIDESPWNAVPPSLTSVTIARRTLYRQPSRSIAADIHTIV